MRERGESTGFRSDAAAHDTLARARRLSESDLPRSAATIPWVHMTTLLPGELAWYVTGRFYAASDGSMADYGYFLHLACLPTPLFAAAEGEASAHFTFAATPFTPRPLINGALSLALDPVGDFFVHYQEQPSGDFNNPSTFACGQRIGHFRRTCVVMGTTVDSGAAPVQKLFANNVFTAKLLHSEPFEFRGRRYDLREMLGAGVTQFGTAPGVVLPSPPAGFDSAVPFSGSALALGAVGS